MASHTSGNAAHWLPEIAIDSVEDVAEFWVEEHGKSIQLPTCGAIADIRGTAKAPMLRQMTRHVAELGRKILMDVQDMHEAKPKTRSEQSKANMMTI